MVTALTLTLAALLERARRRGRAGTLAALAALVIVVDVGSTAIRTLVRRHGSPEPFAIERARELRRDNLPPRSFTATPATDAAR